MKKAIALLLVLSMAASLLGTVSAAEVKPADYTDVKSGDWFADYVAQVSEAGLMNGVGSGKFAPNDTLSRAMFVTILYRAAGSPAVTKLADFTDVPATAWFANGVAWAKANGVVNGKTETAFAPNDPLTREQMVAILYRYVGADTPAGCDLAAYPDANAVSDYACDAFTWATNNGIVNGKDGKLQPKGTTTRAEAAAVLTRWLSAQTTTRADLEKAVVATGWAYLAKGAKMQYGSAELSRVFSKYYGGKYRITEGAAPEYGTDDTTIYSVCSDYVYKTYLNALGYALFDSPDYIDATTEAFWSFADDYGATLIRCAGDGYQVDREAAARGLKKEDFASKEEAKAFISDWKNTLRPGDVMVVNNGSGHALLYIGDGWMLDSRGTKYSMSTGVEAREINGAVYYIYNVEDVFVTGADPNWKNYTIDRCEYFIAMRPINILVQDDGDGNPANDKLKNTARVLPASSASREQYPLMDINRTVDITPYGTAATGETLTYTVEITNRSDTANYLRTGASAVEYKELPVTERIPAGTELVEGSITEGGKYENGVISWTVTLPAGKSVSLTYSVKVTAKQGETITSGGGFVADIPSNVITNAVGGKKLSAEAVSGLSKLADTPVADWRAQYNISALTTGTDFAERVYAKGAGLQLDLPDLSELVFDLFRYEKVVNQTTTRREPFISSPTKEGTVLMWTNSASDAAKMIVPGYVGGGKTQFGQSNINEFNADYLEAGDILVYANVHPNGKLEETRVSVVAADGKLLSVNNDNVISVAAGGVQTEDLLWKAFTYDVFFLLRPTLAYAETNTPYSGEEPSYGEEPAPASTEYKPLSEENKAKFQKLITADPAWSGKNTAFVEAVYDLVGIDLETLTASTTIVTLLNAGFRDTGANAETGAKYQYVPVFDTTSDNASLAAMFRNEFRGGPHMVKDETMLENPTIDDLEIGDALFLVHRATSTYWVGVYLGDGMMILSRYSKGADAVYDLHDFSDEAGAAEFEELLKTNPDTGEAWEYFIAISPQRGFRDINTGRLR